MTEGLLKYTHFPLRYIHCDKMSIIEYDMWSIVYVQSRTIIILSLDPTYPHVLSLGGSDF